MKRYVVLGVITLVLVWGWLRAFAWFDPTWQCRIRIDVELLEGDRAPIRAAIAVVRREDPLAYHALCRWIDRIQEERRCDAGDPQAVTRQRGPALIPSGAVDAALLRAQQAPGCYVRGSRVIVLRRPAEGAGGPALVRERAETLKRLAGYSEAFWSAHAR
jgi:hypothetical protein